MAVVLKEQLELRPSVALQKKVGLKSLEQVIRWGDRVNQELRRLRKLEDRKCWRAWARHIRKKSHSGSSGLSKAQALVELEAQERGYQKEVEKVRKWWLEALEEAEVIIQPEEKLILWRAEDQVEGAERGVPVFRAVCAHAVSPTDRRLAGPHNLRHFGDHLEQLRIGE